MTNEKKRCKSTLYNSQTGAELTAYCREMAIEGEFIKVNGSAHSTCRNNWGIHNLLQIKKIKCNLMVID